MAREPEKVIRDGKVAVLISPGFGAGWSTWASADQSKLLLFDRRFVEAVEAGVADIEPIAKEVTGDEYVCCLGWHEVRIEWLPVGTAFTVEEYDGSESLRTVSDLAYVA
jgi:hypothetical protein